MTDSPDAAPEGVSENALSMQDIPAALSATLAARGYETLTPVQCAVIAPDVVMQDLLVSAQTGSGKTVAFGLAMGQNLLGEDGHLPRANSPQALIIAPTRELALQVKEELTWLFKDAGAKLASCVGGMDYRTEISALKRGPHIVVGTPGRLKDHIDRGTLDLSALDVAVLDEADEMLNMGFSEDLEYILARSPKERRTLMFSATVPSGIARLAKKYQQNAQRLTVKASTSQHADIEYTAVTVGAKDRQNAIINLLRYYEAPNAIIFAGTRVAVNHLTARLNNRGFSVVSLSGELSQSQRSHALAAMRNGQARVCVATDVAARGIDLPGLELVIHAEMPKNSEILLHRSGRTGRAGRKGSCVLLATPSGRRRTERLLRDAKVSANWKNAPSADDVRRRDDERLMAMEAFATPPAAEDAELIAKINAQFSPEQVTSALLTMYRAGRSAPEDVRAVADDDNSHLREDMKDGVWYSLSVGREKRADLRWMLPMLINSGGLDKREIGAIKIMRHETFVEIAGSAANGFDGKLGADGKLENDVNARRLPEKPAVVNSRGGGGGGGGGGDRRDRSGRHGGGGSPRSGHKGSRPSDRPRKKSSGSRDSYRPEKDNSHKKEGSYKKDGAYKEAVAAHADKRPDGTTIQSDPFFDNALDTRSAKPKKPHKKKLARAAARAGRDGAGAGAGSGAGSGSGAGAGKSSAANPARNPAEKKGKSKNAIAKGKAKKAAKRASGPKSGPKGAPKGGDAGGEARLMRRKRS